MRTDMYGVTFCKYLDGALYGKITPKRRFQNRDDLFKYVDYLEKLKGNIYPIFKKCCLGSIENGDFCEFKLGWNIPKHIRENLSIDELKILYWMCFNRYCCYTKFVGMEIHYNASYRFSVY